MKPLRRIRLNNASEDLQSLGEIAEQQRQAFLQKCQADEDAITAWLFTPDRSWALHLEHFPDGSTRSVRTLGIAPVAEA